MHPHLPRFSPRVFSFQSVGYSPASCAASEGAHPRGDHYADPGQGRLIEVRLSAKNLLNKDHLSLSDPFAVLRADHFGVGVERLGETETVFDDLNPCWVSRFLYPMRDLKNSNILVDIYDRDSNDKSALLSRHDFLGRCEFGLGELLNAPCQRLTLDLLRMQGVTKGRKDRGTVSLFAELLSDEHTAMGAVRAPLPGSRQMRTGKLVLRVNCASLKRKVAVGAALKTRQFYEIQRRRKESCGGVSWTTIYRSENGRKLNAGGYIEFKTVSMDELKLHNGQPDRELRFAFFSRNIRKDHDRVCYAQTTAAELADCHENGEHKSGCAVPLVGDFQDYDGMGAMQIVGSRRDDRRDDVLVLDINVDIFMLPGRLGYVSALNRNFIRPGRIGRGMTSRVRSMVSLH